MTVSQNRPELVGTRMRLRDLGRKPRTYKENVPGVIGPFRLSIMPAG
jgi:hypothetical protein